MNYENICKFVPDRSTSGDMNVLNFVFERNCNDNPPIVAYSFTAGIVKSGHGSLIIDNRTYEIKKGDLFFTFPSKLYCFESTDKLEFYFISFTGTRASSLTNRAYVNVDRAVIYSQDDLLPLWETAHQNANQKNIDLIAEGILLYTFARVSTTIEEKHIAKHSTDIIIQIKKYIEENIDDPTLSLKTVAKRFLYNDKYISEKFRRTVRIGFSDYIKKLRLERAIHLIDNGVKSVSEIARLCGYTDPLYFSKVFKGDIGQSPKKYIEGVHNK